MVSSNAEAQKVSRGEGEKNEGNGMNILPWFIECPKVARDSKPKIFIIVFFNSVSCVQLKTGDYKLSYEGECSPISCDHYKCSHTQPLSRFEGTL